MIFKEKIIFFILTFTWLNANLVQLSSPIIPKIDCKDINKNDKPDFISFNSSNIPRTIYHTELSDSIIILWEYSMPKNIEGYFIDAIISDFDNNGSKELIVIAYQDENDNIFYIFNYEENAFTNNEPIITKIKNKSDFNNPQNIYLMNSDNNKESLFIITQGSPNRKVSMCAFIKNEIIEIESLANNFLNSTMSTIDISLGDFDGDGGKDIFILDKGFKPSGYFIYYNGIEQKEPLSDFPRIKSIYKNSVDINFDGLDDLVMIDRNNQILTSIWGNEPLFLSENNIAKIILNPENGFIYLTSIDKSGDINNYSIDPLSKNILSNEYNKTNLNVDDKDQISFIISSNKILSFKNGINSELEITPLNVELFNENPLPNQLIYNQKPDYSINLGDNFNHSIAWDTNMVFRNFNSDKIPENMSFDLTKLHLNWMPKSTQLGYHELNYTLNLRDSGPLKINLDDGKMFVSKNDTIVEKKYSFLLYVNSPTLIDIPKDSITVVNGSKFEWKVPITDKNADANLFLKLIGESQNASFNLIKPEIELVPITIIIDSINQKDALITINDSLLISKNDTITIQQQSITDSLISIKQESTYIDSIQTDFESFVENKINSETDAFKKKKQESSVKEFRTKEEEYREKLKTHKKVLKDGKNIWIPIDSLNITDNYLDSDSSNILENKIKQEALIDSSIENIIIDSKSLNVVNKIDSIKVNTINNDTTDLSPEITEISYKELVNHQALFSWFPNNKPGYYDFSLFASDGYTSDTTTFVINLHPKIDLSQNITSYNATINKMFNTTIKIKQKPQSKNYSFQLINAPKNMRIDTSGTIYWVPLSTQVDDYKFKIEVSDGIAASTITYNIFVNAPPVISSRPSKIFVMPLNDSLRFPLKGFDLNSISFLSWKLYNGPSSMSLDSNGLLTWKSASLGHHLYTVQLSDGIDSVNWEGSIYVNDPPEFTSQPVTSVLKNEKYTYQLSAKDANIMSPYDSLLKNQITFSLAQGPDSMKINENSTLFWDTNDNPLGEYMVAISASDGANDAIQVFPVFINAMPIISSPDSISIALGDTLRMQIEAYDPNINDTLTFHFKNSPKGLNLQLNDGKINWLPQKSDLGPHKLILSVKDGHDNIGTEMLFTIFVYRPPILTSKLPSEAFINLEYSVLLTAEDLYGNKLSKSESIKIDSASFNYYNLSEYAHLFKWTPREVDKGNHKLIIKLTDEYGFSSKHIHNLNVFTNPCIDCNNDDAPSDSTGN